MDIGSRAWHVQCLLSPCRQVQPALVHAAPGPTPAALPPWSPTPGALPPRCLRSGVDGLAHDPVVGAGWGLTPQAYADCAQQAASWGLPLLVLGGGGYSSPAAARAWASLMAALQVVELPRDIPEHEFFDRHGPSFCFADSKPLLAPESNDRAAVLAGCSSLLAELRKGLGAAVPRHGAAKRARA